MKERMRYIIQHNCQQCGDFKVVSLFLGLQDGYTNIVAFIANGAVVTEVLLPSKETGHDDNLLRGKLFSNHN